MRKIGLCLIIFMLFAMEAFSQLSSPIIGYDKVQWGASIQSVIQVYPSIKELSSDDSAIGIREFTQHNVGNGIEVRYFFFFNNKLYKVAVHYEEQDNISTAFMALAAKLIEIYGKFDEQSNSSTPSGTDVLKFVDLIRYYNKNMTIFLRGIDIYNRYNNLIGNSLVVIYSDPIIESDIETAKRSQKKNSFGL
jgi:hypothetical protein